MKLTLYFLGVFVLIRAAVNVHKYGFWAYVAILAAEIERAAYRLRNWAGLRHLTREKQRTRNWQYPE